jgi:hypothetical protein
MALPADASASIDCERLSKVLMEPDETVPREMVDALYYVNETASDEDMDFLLDLASSRNVNIEHAPDTTTADVAVQMWLAEPDLLREHHAEAVAFRQRNFLYYGGGNGEGHGFPNVDHDLRREIETTLDDWFEKHRRGRGCRLFLFPRGDKVWILVRHGQPMRREASHGEGGEPATEFYRPQLHDVLIYDGSSDEIGVHANTKGETKLYLPTLGRLVFGDEHFFPPADKFTLDPLIEDGADALLCEDVDGLKQIRLVEFRRYWGGEFQEIEIRRASDVFGAMAKRQQNLGSKARLVTAVFKVKFEGAPKERSVTIRPPGNAKYERNEDSDVIESWLAKRGFIVDVDVAADDEETPTSLVENA